jgi:hypothetical protein
MRGRLGQHNVLLLTLKPHLVQRAVCLALLQHTSHTESHTRTNSANEAIDMVRKIVQAYRWIIIAARSSSPSTPLLLRGTILSDMDSWSYKLYASKENMKKSVRDLE